MNDTGTKQSILKLIGMAIFIIIFFPAVIITLSGNISWIEGWIFCIWFEIMMLTNILYMYKKNPELLTERLNAHGSHNQKKWDRYLLGSLFLLSALWIVSIPLDVQRFHWSPLFPLYIKIIGIVILIFAMYFLIRPTIDNPYLSTVVRIQSDRKQQVISTGVYSIIRHPQYLGIVMLILSGPLFLGSMVGLIIGVFIVIDIVIRIIGEEKMLIKELDGYSNYKKKVKYRLLPFIW